MLTQLIIDLLPFPGGNRDHGTDVLQKVMSKRLHVPETDSPGAIKRALNESGWIDGKVLAAGDVRQGKEPSVVSMLTGSAVIEVMRRRLKALPRHFVMAVTDERVVAYKVISSGDEFGDVYELWIRHEEIGSWPRSSVRMDDGLLEVDGKRAPVFRADKDPSTEELFAVLAG
jgi:hypothetical protein